MSLVRGLIVRSLRGRDKDEFLVMLETSGREVAVCNGKHHPPERPKRKNPIHLVATDTLLSSVSTNREVHCAL